MVDWNKIPKIEVLGEMVFTQDEAERICKYNALEMVGLINK